MPEGLFKFTPALEDPGVLQATLVGREKELRRLFQAIREGAEKKGNQHFLLVGPRGIGKTHLLLLLYHSVKGTIAWDELCRNLGQSWVPILFSEEEYRITSLLDLLLEILARLKEELLDGQLLRLTTRLEQGLLPGEEEKELILDYLRKKRQEMGKKFLLLLDNLHDILPHFTEEDKGRLRDILMHGDLFMLIGTAPTLFDTVIDHEAPFYNFFEVIWLQEIGEDQVKELLAKRLRLDNRDDLLEKLDKYEDRLKALVHLTGGNPRLILSLYQIFTESKIIEVERDFKKLLDEMTPYFQDRMKELPPQQRKIVDALALADGPITPTEIARLARLPVKTVNSQLNRLKEAGFVRRIKERKRREVLYDINERLFRLWRQMRVEAGRKRLRFIVKFIEIWFSPWELAEQFAEFVRELEVLLSAGSFEKAKEVIDKLYYIQEAATSPLRERIHFQRVYGLAKAGDLESAKREVRALLTKARAKDDAKLLAQALWERAFLCDITGDLDGQLEALQRYTELKPDDANAWNNMGVAYAKKGEHDEAIGCYRRAVEIKPEMHEAWYNMGIAYAEKGEYDEAISCYRKAVEIKPEMHEAWYNMGNAYAEKGEYDEAISCYRKAVEIKPDMHEAWYNMGVVYAKKGEYYEASRAFSKALELVENNKELAVPLLVNRAISYIAVKRYSSALKDAERAYQIAREMDFRPLFQAAAMLAAIGALGLSKKNVAKKNFSRALDYLERSLKYIPDVPTEVGENLIGRYFKDLLGITGRAFMESAIQAIEGSGRADLVELLKPYRVALQYIDKKDKTILNRLVPELREIVEEIVTKLESRD